TQDLAANRHFATEIVGLEVVDETPSTVYVRGDNRDHNICYFICHASNASCIEIFLPSLFSGTAILSFLGGT
ncbi:hypothetical protein, partial [Mycolicibacterium hippocampi]|uniref:hypothetical protein n=1 Tax=Mycolicibacterium hippocampi TaxID=659824 RepID=UPI003513CE72